MKNIANYPGFAGATPYFARSISGCRNQTCIVRRAIFNAKTLARPVTKINSLATCAAERAVGILWRKQSGLPAGWAPNGAWNSRRIYAMGLHTSGTKRKFE